MRKFKIMTAQELTKMSDDFEAWVVKKPSRVLLLTIATLAFMYCLFMFYYIAFFTN